MEATFRIRFRWGEDGHCRSTRLPGKAGAPRKKEVATEGRRTRSKLAVFKAFIHHRIRHSPWRVEVHGEPVLSWRLSSPGYIPTRCPPWMSHPRVGSRRPTSHPKVLSRKSRPVPPKVHRAAAHSAWPGPRKASCRAPCARERRRKKPEDASLLSLRTPLTTNPVWHWRASKLQSTKGSGQMASAPNHSRRRVMVDRAALIPPQRPEGCCGIVIVGSPTSGQIVLMDHTQLVSESSEPS